MITLAALSQWKLSEVAKLQTFRANIRRRRQQRTLLLQRSRRRSQKACRRGRHLKLIRDKTDENNRQRGGHTIFEWSAIVTV